MFWVGRRQGQQDEAIEGEEEEREGGRKKEGSLLYPGISVPLSTKLLLDSVKPSQGTVSGRRWNSGTRDTFQR